MAAIFGSVSILCLIYYIVIVIYSGIKTSFAVVWLIFAAGFGLTAAAVHFYDRFRDKIPLRLTVSVITAAAALFTIFLLLEAAIAVNLITLGNQSVDYVIVLGAQVKGEKLSRSLEYRLDKAYEYAAVHPNTVFVLSGGQGGGENIPEAEAMHRYLRDRGVPENQMILEDQSTSTYENIVYSKLLIDAREAGRRTAVKGMMLEDGYQWTSGSGHNIHIGIVTSNYHMMRAKGIAKKTGIQAPYGISAKSDPILFVHQCVRESLAILKDKIVGNM